MEETSLSPQEASSPERDRGHGPGRGAWLQNFVRLPPALGALSPSSFLGIECMYQELFAKWQVDSTAFREAPWCIGKQ
jgi:hypothetical protein